LLQCSPVCLKQNGPVTTLTSESMCAGEPMDMCKCKCYYDAEWVCKDDSVVCMAKRGVEASVVGDLVCETRGTPKPTVEQMENSRQAGECIPMKTTRGGYPTAQCMDIWATTVAPEEPSQEPEEPSQEPSTEEEVEDGAQLEIKVDDSFSAVTAFALAVLLQ
jgi:hypothetical protein